MSKWIIYLMIAFGFYVGLSKPGFDNYREDAKVITALMWPMSFGVWIAPSGKSKCPK